MIGRGKKLEALQAEFERLTPYIDIARELSAAAAGVAEHARSDPDLLRERLKDEIARQTGLQQQTRIREIFDELPPDQRANLLLQIYGDNTLRVALEKQRAEANAQTLVQLGHLAAATGGVDLTLLPHQSVMKVWLYDESSYAEHGIEAVGENYNELRILRAAHLGRGRFQILEDEHYSDTESDSLTFTPSLNYHQVVDFGSMLNRGMPDERLEPVLYQGAPMDSSVIIEGRFSVQDTERDIDELLVVGFLAVNEVEILT